ncbi:MAG: hypothetical protein IH865_11810 [Chloroflexi bacterium]|nr:hypothetical protein [Chloroflexota bacterium]
MRFVGILFGVAGAIILAVVLLVVAIAYMLTESGEDLEEEFAKRKIVTVLVSGDEGIRFSGSIGTIDGSRSVQGTTPQKFTLTGSAFFDVFTVIIQKDVAQGRLAITLRGCDEGNKTESTVASFGLVSVIC